MEQIEVEDAASAIGTIDIGVIVAYFAVVLLIGIVVARRTETGEDLFLAGRSLGWGVIGFSPFASNISSTTPDSRTSSSGRHAWALGVFAGSYTAAGGLKAVVYTDLLQAVVLILGTTLMTVIMFDQLGWSWSNVVEAAPSEDHLSMVRPLDDEMLPWPGLIVGVSLLGFWYWVTNQYIVQRVLGAKDLQNAQYGAILGGFLKLLPRFTMVLPGAMAII